MDSRYAGFVERNPAYEQRVAALTAGMLSPDPKLPALWSMESGRYYSQAKLYRTACDFAGVDLPVDPMAVWSYYTGPSSGNPHGRGNGVLCVCGAVERQTQKGGDEGNHTGRRNLYAKTAAGADFGDAMAARALAAFTMIRSRKRSVQSVLGTSKHVASADENDAHLTCRVAEILSCDPGRTFRLTDLQKATGASMSHLSGVVNRMGDAGTIDYESPNRETGGRKHPGWARYRLVSTVPEGADRSPRSELMETPADELYGRVRAKEPGFHYSTAFLRIVEHMKRHPDDDHSVYGLSGMLSLRYGAASNALHALKSFGYVDSRFSGGDTVSSAAANHDTLLLWGMFFGPALRVADRLDPGDCDGFNEPLHRYLREPELRTGAFRALFGDYSAERTHLGMSGGLEIRSALLALPPGHEMKMGHIVDTVNAGRLPDVSRAAVKKHIRTLLRDGSFVGTRPGFFMRADGG